jgi:YidC/Oxa1 family membrane protein insertase
VDDKRNIIMAVLLTGIILFGWQYVVEFFFPEMAQTEEVVEQSATETPSQTAGGDPSTVSTQPGTSSIATEVAGAAVSLPKALKANPRVAIETPRVSGSINLTGARLDDLTLTDHRVSQNKDSAPIRLFAPSGTKDAYFGRFGWAGDGVAVPGNDTVWTADSSKLTPDTPVTLSWSNEAGQTFAITYSIDENYLITAEQSVTNNGEAPVALNPFGLLSRVRDLENLPTSEQSSWTIRIGPMGVFEEVANFDYDYEDVAEAGANGVAVDADKGWIGFTDRYWLGALIPERSAKVDAKFRAGNNNIYQAQIAGENAKIIAPGQSLKTTTRVFAGAKETVLLDTYKEQYNIPLLDRAVDWGWFYWFEKPLFYMLDWLFKLVGNFGVAIILMTFVVRGVMFPIAQKQFASMAQMRAVQPKMKKLQERFKDDKQKQQQEIMKLYKDEKVNPLAGCLPIFLQIPIFFALYKVLMLSIEMRHQPFALWIQDLSAPDPMTPVNLFGLLPFDPPSFLAVGILPILMGITMHLQFKLNPAPMEEMQKQIFAIMPWILVFIMAPFAAGLQLYWTVSNILTIAQQKWLYSRHPQLKEQAAKEAEEKAKNSEAEAKS